MSLVILILTKTHEIRVKSDALRISEQKYREIYNSPSDVIFIHDASTGEILDVNRAILDMYGYDQEEALQLKIGDFSSGKHPYTQDQAEKLVNKTIVDGPQMFEWQAKKKSGEFFWVEIVSQYTESQDAGYVIAVVRNITERKQTEGKLFEDDRRLRAILDASPIGIGLVIDRKMDWANAAMYRMIGYEERSLQGENARILYSDQDEYERVGRELYANADTPEKSGVETVWVRKDGTHFDCILRMRPLDFENPSRGQIVTVADVSDLHRAHKELQKSEERYRSVFENTGAATVILEKDGTISMANAGFEKLSGHTREEIEGKKQWSEYVVEKDIERMKEIFAERRKNGGDVPTEYTFRFVDRQGDMKDVFIKAGMIPGTDKSVSSLIDITPIKRAEDELRQSEEKYRGFFEASKDVVYMTSADGRFIDINDSGLKLFGIERDELDKINVAKDAYEDPADRVIFTEMIDKNGYSAGHEVNLRKMDGTVFPATITAVTVKDTEGNIVGYQGIIRDETERKNLEGQLRQAQKMEAVGTLAGGIAHDFNNLLTAILGNTSLILMQIDSCNPEYENLNNIKQCVKSGAELTKQLLGFAKGGAYDVRPTNFNDIVQKTSDMFGRTKKEIAIHAKYSDELWTAEVDSSQMEQVLINLYVNAWQAMPAGGELYLETENVILDEDYVKPYETDSGKYVKVSVTDTGVGMDEATRLRIFEPFFTTREMGRGTGLGLASAYGIIRRHRGIINVYSEKEHGTTFNIYLPASELVVRDQEIGVRKEDIRQGEEAILLVDDEEMIIDVTARMLQGLGYKILTAGSGEEAIEIYRENMNVIDLVILDMIMPGLGGGETYDMLRDINPDVRAILSSGYSMSGQAAKILKRGCNSFIQKPFSMKALSMKIREVMDKD